VDGGASSSLMKHCDRSSIPQFRATDFLSLQDSVRIGAKWRGYHPPFAEHDPVSQFDMGRREFPFE